VPTEYDGDPEATEAPSDPPEPEGTITLLLPVDDDDVDGSAFAQAYKVLADFIAWLLKPTAKALDFAMHIMAWRTATGHKRFRIDHLGFPGGQYIGWDEDWTYSALDDYSSRDGTLDAAFLAFPAWRYKATGTGAAAATNLHNSPECTAMFMLGGDTIGVDYVTITRGRGPRFRAGNHIVLEFLAGVQGGAAGYDDKRATIGLGTWLGGSISRGSGDIDNFIGFEKKDGFDNWFAVARAAGVETATAVDTGVAVSQTLSRMRVEWHGEDVSEDGLRRVRYYIDGALVATFSANLPIGQPGDAVIGEAPWTGTPTGTALIVGPMSYRASMFGDVA
jgi:hypothetical protein